MAINRNEYINKVKQGLKANKNYKKFFYRFKIDGKTFYTTFDYSKKNWDKRTCISKAEIDAIEFKENKKNPKTLLDENIKLNYFIEMHFDKLPNTTWTMTKKRHYLNYLKTFIGNKKVKDIKQMHIKECIKNQENNNLAPRTIKTTLEILNPVFKEAFINRLIDFNPCEGITIKRVRTKKTVLNASDELLNIYQTINTIFGNNPFYLSFYLFAVQGRRKSEILNLKWENIDFKNNLYLIEDTKNGEHQLYNLPTFIKKELLKFKSPTGWIYESSINQNEKMVNIEKQTKKIKKILPNFTLHRLRNVIVSAMAEQGISATLMSGALGHNNTSTLSKYLTLNHIKGSEEANRLIEKLANQL